MFLIAKKIRNVLVLLLLVSYVVSAQEFIQNKKIPLIDLFTTADTPEKQFELFFSTAYRYNISSTYDWESVVDSFLVENTLSDDSIAAERYQIIKAQLLFDRGEFAKSIALANSVYDTKEKLNLGAKKVLLNLIDENYSQLQLYDKQFAIRNEKKELGLTEDVSFYDIYANLGVYSKAKNDYIMEVKKTIDENDLYKWAVYHNQLGVYLLLDKSTQVALNKFKEAKSAISIYLNNTNQIKTEEELNEANYLKGIIEGNLGRSYKQLRKYDIAIPLLESSIESINKYHKRKFSTDFVENTLELADSHLQLGNYTEAFSYLSDSLEPIKIENQLKKNRLIGAYYDRIGDYKNAAIFLKKNERIRDSLSENAANIKEQQLTAIIGQDLANTKNVVSEQKEALEKFGEKILAKDEQINMVFISLIFTLLGFAGMVYAYLKSVKSQRLITEQKRIIEASLVEKDSLLKEIHHRVKNNLQMVSSLLSLQTKNTKSKSAIIALEEGKSRVKAMALIHQKLYQNDDLSVIEMQGYIESLVNSVQSVYKKGGHNINITIDAEGVELDIDRAIPFGLILNELVSNSFKYAFGSNDENGKIYIHLRKNGIQGFFEYMDNGIGLPPNKDVKASASMGIRLMNRLVNQLQSDLKIDSPDEGVRFWFEFK